MVKKINKKNILLIISGMSMFILVTILIINLNNNISFGVTNNPDGEKIKEEYEKLNGQTDKQDKIYPEVQIPSNNIIKYTNTNELLSIFKKKQDAVIYFGYPSCLYCRSVIEVLLNSYTDSGLDTIYYLDTEKTNGNEELYNHLGEEIVVTENNIKKIFSPSVVFVIDGEVVSYNKDTIYSHSDPYKELDNSGIEGLSEIYRLGIKDVVASKKLK